MGITDKLDFQKKRSKTLIYSLLLAGIFPYKLPKFDIRKYVWTYYTFFSFSYLIIFTAYNLTMLHGFMVRVAIVKTILSAVMCFMVFGFTYVKRKDLMHFIKLTENNFYTYSDEAKFKYRFSISATSEKVFLFTAAMYFVCIYSSAVLSHPIYLLFNRNLLKSGAKMLIFTWVPFKGDTMASFYAAHLALLILTIPVLLTMIGNVFLTLNIQMEFQNQFERLTYALNSIRYRIELEMPKKKDSMEIVTFRNRVSFKTRNCDIVPFSEEVNRKFEEKLIECVKHYMKIVEGYKRFHSWFSLTYSVILVHSVLTLAMMSYGALLNIKNFGVSIKYVSILSLYTGQAFLQCLSGEKIFGMNEKLSNEIYNLPWYNQPAPRRKLLYIFLCETQRQMQPTGLLIYPASHQIFSSIMKLSYSYLNLLRTYGSSFRGK